MSFRDVAVSMENAAQALEDRMNPDLEKCSECGDAVHVMAFKGTKLCSEICRKKRAGEITADEHIRLHLRGTLE